MDYIKIEEQVDCLIVGCGLTGSVIARELAEQKKKIMIWERRDHIGGNMFSYTDKHGFQIHKYGPHAFHTNKRELYAYVCQYEQWQEYKPICGAVLNKVYTPTPFNFKTIDIFYTAEKGKRLKDKLRKEYFGQKTVPITAMLEHPDSEIREYAEFLFQNDYAPYTAKQWGVSASEIDPSVLRRVPIRFSYKEELFDDSIQVMPVHSYTTFFENLLNHPNILVKFGTDALDHLSTHGEELRLDGRPIKIPVVYTGALDELFGGVYGQLPYRSLRFEWKYSPTDSFQPAAVVAYPQEVGYTRITEYKKYPPQALPGTSYVLEYPLPYVTSSKQEPYYPVLTEKSVRCYQDYLRLAHCIPNLIPCGRLADFKYYNMDDALERALGISKKLYKSGGLSSI